MTNVQPTYPTALAIGVAGMIASEEKANKISRTVESAAGLVFGQPAFRGSNDHGCVVGGTFAATSVGAADAGNTGAGTITAAPAVAAGAKAGRYIIQATSAGATAAWSMFDPDGLLVGDGAVGTAATIAGIGPFTITDAGTDPAIGDRWFIDVTYTANAKFLGLAVLNPAVPANATTPDAYPQYATAALMTMGVMYVVAGGVVNDGDAVYWDPATTRYVADTTKIRIPNTRFDTTTAANGDLVKVATRLRDA